MMGAESGPAELDPNVVCMVDGFVSIDTAYG